MPSHEDIRPYGIILGLKKEERIKDLIPFKLNLGGITEKNANISKKATKEI